LLVGLLVLLAGVGVVIGALWSRPGKVDIDRQEVLQPGFDPSSPPPLPDSSSAEESEVENPLPRFTEIPQVQPVPPSEASRPAAEPVSETTTEHVSAPVAEPTPVVEPAGPTAGELWSQAYRLKDEKRYHSLREVLDRLLAKDANYGQAREWRRKVDGWIASREKDLRGETDDLIDELIDALDDRDESNLAELWGDSLDPASRAFAQELWSLGPKLKWNARIRSFKPRDDRADFEVVIAIAEKSGKKREVTWRGSMADDSQGTRFTVPLR
jgi:hypothetical protein